MINIQILRVLPAAVPLFCVTTSAHDTLRCFSFLVFLCLTLFLNSFSLTPPLSVHPSLATACPSLPLSVSLHLPPPLLFLPFPLGSSAKVGRRSEANTAQGRAEGDPKAGELIMSPCVSRRPSVTLCTDRRTHASRRGLWEGGVAHRGCAPLFSFPFFPPSRPSSPPVLRPSPPLTYRLQTGRRKDRPSPLLSDLRGSTEPERCCCVQDSYLCGSLMLKQHGCCPWG
ncbi:uncharacterized protein LOC122882433 isoform X1 [Siniperca chuatsi]|uniref:uncharacterized protein LOC122882433 isoform X1 n=1 Tax=Siniperca chuatsi TaxID=119488 RepID=UPI001CE0738D|nr:uncharacterized protein LOC122882433 isoform X1 [Siniperca chuatsi]